MPDPHETFSEQFITKLKKALGLARRHEQAKEVWALCHFDQDLASLETFHSNGSTGAIFYKNAQDALNKGIARITDAAPSKQDKIRSGQLAKMIADVQIAQVPPSLNMEAMHAEENLIRSFPKMLSDWQGMGKPYPQSACIYLNWSPCGKSPARVEHNVNFPVGCMNKIVTMAQSTLVNQIMFTVYFDTIFENTENYRSALAGAAVNVVKFIPMPDILK